MATVVQATPEPAIKEQSARTLTMVQAINEALKQAMRSDDTVLVLGENVGVAGGVMRATAGILEEFGPRRIVDTPISENGFTGMAVGMALTGLRPVVDMMFGDFITLAMDQLVNQAAHIRYMTGGQAKVPLVIRTMMGAGRSLAGQHSQSLHAWLAHIPGLKIVMPSTPYDAKGLLIQAVRDDNPVIFYEDKLEYGRKGAVPEEPYTIPFGVADVKRRGDDVTIVATSSMVHVALEAANVLAQDSIQAEVIDPRTLVPLDEETIVCSVIKTGRAVVVDEGYRNFGVGAELSARISESEAFDYLEYPVARIGALDVPIPFSPPLEKRTIPNAEWVVRAVQEMF